MSNKNAKQLKTVKSLDFGQWTATFWLVKRKIVQREARYTVLRVDIDAKLQKRFKGYLKQQLQSKDFHVTEYDYNNADGDDALFTIDAEATDFTKVEAAINEGFDNPHATNYSELLSSWAYVLMFEKGSERLYAWRKISSDTQPKKVNSKGVIFFINHKLMDVEDKEVFMIYPHYDFFVYQGTTFIADKRHFESSMNFREGMKQNANEVLANFEQLKIFSDVDIIREFVGTNLHHLRKLSSIRKAGYYKQPNYMKKLIVVSAQEKWDLKIVDGKIVVEPETVELLLKLLNNDRLRSPINDELFDSAAKAPVAKKTTVK